MLVRTWSVRSHGHMEDDIPSFRFLAVILSLFDGGAHSRRGLLEGSLSGWSLFVHGILKGGIDVGLLELFWLLVMRSLKDHRHLGWWYLLGWSVQLDVVDGELTRISVASHFWSELVV